MSLLDNPNLHQDLKKMTTAELTELAKEIRVFLIESVSKTGGHLAPSLGVVELTLALHKTFSTPTDKIIWDVGHQSYTHKILTGRKKDFATLRQYGGLSGFPKRSESPHDAFDTGHSSTSISAGLGMVVARDLKNEKFEVVSVIGDGALTGGMALEALNNVGDLGKKIIIVLNDNEMSISKNVGAMAEYLCRMRTAPRYSRIKRDVEDLLKNNLPSISTQVIKTVERVKDSLKYLLVPGMLFEDLGLTYMGPIDGHNLDLLQEVMLKAKEINGPVLVHVITNKGCGYAPAEENAGKFHGVGPFKISSGDKIVDPHASITYTEVFSKTLLRLAAKNPLITAITAAMPDGTGLTRFSKVYPTRFFDVGIAEQHAVTLAAGMAAQGLKPLVALYSTFSQRAYDQILHDVCLQNLPVVIALDRAGLVGDDGPTHHGIFDFSFLRSIPNITIMSPKDEAELEEMLVTAFTMNTPVVLRYPRGSGLGVELNNKECSSLPIGKVEQIINIENAKTVILAIGSMVYPAMAVQEKLLVAGIPCDVVNARFVKPLDREFLQALPSKYSHLVTMEESLFAGGFGSGVLEFLNQEKISLPTTCFAIGDQFVTHGNKKSLFLELGLDVDSMTERIKREIF